MEADPPAEEKDMASVEMPEKEGKEAEELMEKKRTEHLVFLGFFFPTKMMIL